MRYFGGKGTVADQLCTLINQWMKPGQLFIEPFVGSGWIVRGIRSQKRMASDTNKYLIAMYKALQNGWVPPTSVSQSEYEALKEKVDAPGTMITPGLPELIGFVGHFCSFGGMWFSCLAKDGRRDYIGEAARGVLKIVPQIKNVEFKCCDYNHYIPSGAFIYCDPPYDSTNQPYYSKKFDSLKFWDTVRQWSKNNIVIVSEYNAPEDFTCIEEIRVRMKMNSELRFEKVFSLNEKYDPFGGIF